MLDVLIETMRANQEILGGLALLVGLTIMVAIVRSLLPDKRLLRNGERARATVLSVTPSSMQFSDEMRYTVEVEVHPESGPSFQTRLRRGVLGHRTHLFQPGAELTVRFEQRKRGPRVELEYVGYSGAGVEAGGGGDPAVAELIARQQTDHERLNREGQLADATVVGVEDLGTRVNHVGVVTRLRLKVEEAGGATRDAELVKVIHQDSLDRYGIGANVPVRFDPRSPSVVCVDASRSRLMTES